MLELIVVSFIAGILSILAFWASTKARRIYLKVVFFVGMWAVLGAEVYIAAQLVKLP